MQPTTPGNAHPNNNWSEKDWLHASVACVNYIVSKCWQYQVATTVIPPAEPLGTTSKSCPLALRICQDRPTSFTRWFLQMAPTFI